MRNKWIVILALILLAALIPGTVSASSVFEHQHTTVPAGQTVDDVYIVGGDADIRGHVQGIVVVVNGNAVLADTAVVDGMVLVLGGQVTQSPGAVIGDDVYSLSLDSGTQNSLLLGSGLVLGVWLLQLGGSLLLILLPTVFGLALRKRLESFVGRFAIKQTGRMLYIGFFTGLLLLAISILLLLSIVGIPFILIVLLIGCIPLIPGMAVIGYRIGDSLKLAAHLPDWQKILLGSLVAAAFCNIPVLGWLWQLFISLLSLGICVQWIMQIFRQRA
ncbi:hypothetical protein KIH86_22845 [Paenibacillus sp. HN-1]|uniref:hypothetical protein n=1 Tax=Paenibacillus TaxID=44249 RepID=UPI001CA950A7|nr:MULTISPECIES: hypothetical protein [Paenibacillus]MBY9079309.1 hypothetical protein [Paenibacillus sp. CGMCC 1.18879]MBY9087032.1 hypothetical protein [Paenibacillus sinensis]